MIRKGLKPAIRFGFKVPGEDGRFRRALPFRRAWIAIALVAAMDIAFIIPAVLTSGQALAEWGAYDSLFDLVAALFLSAWLLGWIIAPLILTSVLILMVFGREELRAGAGVVELFLGIPFLGISARYDASRIRNLRLETPPKKSARSWRGPHLVFDYGANTVALGSDIRDDEVAGLRARIETATGAKIRHGDAPAKDTGTPWESQGPAPVEPLAAVTTLNDPPLTIASASTLALIVANLVPVAGSVFLDWNLADVMVLYWAESAVVGFFNVCKIMIIGRWAALFFAPFFVGHFGGFMAIHFLFIYTLFVGPSLAGGNRDGDLAEVALLFTTLWPALAALFISHAFSFYSNFIGRREYRDKTVKDQMSEPYGRIIFMQLVLIFGGGLTMALGSPVPVLLIMIALKVFFDVKAHLKQHSGPGRAAKAPG